MEAIVPTDIMLESSTDCNAHCRFCPNSSITRQGLMKYDLFTKIVDEAVDMGCSIFTPHFLNEPLIFPELFLWLEYIRQKNTKVYIFTNAANLTETVADQLIRYSDIIPVLTISFNGGTREVYEDNMQLDFDLVRNNIRAFMEKPHDLCVRLSCLVWSTTIDTKDQFLALWDDLPFDAVGYVHSHSCAGLRPDEHALGKYMERQPDQFTKFACPRLNQITVLYDGTVVLCCVDALGQVQLGNLREDSIVASMNHKTRLHYRDMHHAGRWGELELCQDCDLNIRQVEQL